ncbi:MAG TPA: sigma 54-interacting transcriptional regulator [Actinomycetota bacterium]|jgi:magnesium chelatase subunit I|nr:sigma 54-interacting transcriptional regulator [Actinomycetota bacterium]
MTERPRTLGELRAADYPDRTVKQELRENLLARLGDGRPLFPGVVGFDDSVLPALERGILAGHDLILLGERGQAKTRLVRAMVNLLDEFVPAIAGTETNDHPYRPISAHGKALVAEHGDETVLTWIAREDRYAEKLATPDTSVGDLIGDVDPIKVAEGRYLGDELTIHYGMIPRTNRGIVAINELPDLPERIQVSLFNILEERDVQIRGYRVRLDLDMLLVATANPDDYTHRGRIVSPLKDRFGTQVRTHYPDTVREEIRIMDQEVTVPAGGVPVRVPTFMKEVVAALTSELRRSPHVNHRSGISVRYSIGNLETLQASAVRRAARTGEPEAVPRVVDLPAVLMSSEGRVEFDTIEEGRETEILLRALRTAELEIFRRRLSGYDFSGLLTRFDEGLSVDTGELTPATDLLATVGDLPGLAKLLDRLGVEEESPGVAASAVEFAMEGLYLSRRLNKDGGEGAARYTGADAS